MYEGLWKKTHTFFVFVIALCGAIMVCNSKPPAKTNLGHCIYSDMIIEQLVSNSETCFYGLLICKMKADSTCKCF